MATLSKGAQRRMQRDPHATVRHWNRDEQAFEFVVTDSEEHSYVAWHHYWSQWITESDDGTNQRSRDHVKESRHWENVQVAQSEIPGPYTIRYPDGTERYVEPEVTESQTAVATRVSAAVRTKGDRPMTVSERKALSRWVKKAHSKQWTCPTHSDPSLADCDLTCREVYTTEREAQVKATLGHMDLTQG